MQAQEPKSIPNEYYCPITGVVMKDPVLMKDGHTYERGAIATHLERNPMSPMTREPLSMADAVPNRALKALIETATSGSFPINLKWPSRTGTSHGKLSVRATDSILSLKAKIAELTGIHESDQKVLFSGTALADSPTIGDYGIGETDCITVARSQCEFMHILIKQ
jgi:hypothetical protein